MSKRRVLYRRFVWSSERTALPCKRRVPKRLRPGRQHVRAPEWIALQRRERLPKWRVSLRWSLRSSEQPGLLTPRRQHHLPKRDMPEQRLRSELRRRHPVRRDQLLRCNVACVCGGLSQRGAVHGQLRSRGTVHERRVSFRREVWTPRRADVRCRPRVPKRILQWKRVRQLLRHRRCRGGRELPTAGVLQGGRVRSSLQPRSPQRRSLRARRTVHEWHVRLGCEVRGPRWWSLRGQRCVSRGLGLCGGDLRVDRVHERRAMWERVLLLQSGGVGRVYEPEGERGSMHACRGVRDQRVQRGSEVRPASRRALR